MRNLILVIGIALMVSCAPGKSGEIVRVDMYCDSCKVTIKNWWYKGDDSGSEIAYSGIVDNYQTVNIERFESDIPCIRVSEYINYGNDTLKTFYIIGSDTIASEYEGPLGYCN